MRLHILLIILIGLMTFAMTFSNLFVGDDEALFLQNPFYNSLSNLPNLFTKNYNTDVQRLSEDIEGSVNSGSVAYRPVLSLTFFLDTALWHKYPFGYHVTNTFLHLINSVLVYLLILSILGEGQLAFLSALIFCVHPLKVEPVSVIGYRADLLATFFILISFLCFIRFLNKNQKVFGVLSGVSLFFGLFTKEIAIFLPVLFLIYERLCGSGNTGIIPDKKIVFKRLSFYVGAIFLIMFYLFIYIKIFPNLAKNNPNYLGSGVGEQFVGILMVLADYIKFFLMPWKVGVIPPFYKPHIADWNFLSLSVSLIFIGWLIYFLFFSQSERKIKFFAWWMIINYIMVSNVVPLVTPMGHRFLYLPSIGVAVLIGYCILKLIDKLDGHKQVIIKTGVVAMCMIMSFLLVFSWKNSFVSALSMIKDYPESHEGYMFAGMQYYLIGENQKAAEYLQKSDALKDKEDIRIPLALANVYFKEKPYLAEKYLVSSLKQWPHVPAVWLNLGQLYFEQKKYDEAQSVYENCLNNKICNDRFLTYDYLSQIALIKKNETKLSEIMGMAQKNLSKKDYSFLKKSINKHRLKIYPESANIQKNEVF